MGDIRWKQRYQNYVKACQTLRDAVELTRSRALSNLEQQGLIQSFEFTHELAWNLLKDYLQHQGYAQIVGSRDATRLAFQNGLIQDGEAWMAMISARNMTSHTYNQEIASQVVQKIIDEFFEVFALLEKTFSNLLTQEGS